MGPSSCKDIQLTDSLDVFEWRCHELEEGNGIEFLSRMKPGRGLRELIDLSTLQWRPISVRLSGDARGETAPEVWWSNTISAVDSSTAAVDLNVSDRIYVESATTTKGVFLNANGVAYVVPRGVALTYNGVTDNCNDSNGTATAPNARCILHTGSRSFLWVEGEFRTETLVQVNLGIFLYNTTYSHVRNTNVGPLLFFNTGFVVPAAVYMNDGRGNRFETLHISGLRVPTAPADDPGRDIYGFYTDETTNRYGHTLRGIRISDVQGGTAADATFDGGLVGGNATAMRLHRMAGLILEDVVISGIEGGTGINGADGTSASATAGGKGGDAVGIEFALSSAFAQRISIFNLLGGRGGTGGSVTSGAGNGTTGGAGGNAHALKFGASGIRRAHQVVLANLQGGDGGSGGDSLFNAGGVGGNGGEAVGIYHNLTTDNYFGNFAVHQADTPSAGGSGGSGATSGVGGFSGSRALILGTMGTVDFEGLLLTNRTSGCSSAITGGEEGLNAACLPVGVSGAVSKRDVDFSTTFSPAQNSDGVNTTLGLAQLGVTGVDRFHFENPFRMFGRTYTSTWPTLDALGAWLTGSGSVMEWIPLSSGALYNRLTDGVQQSGTFTVGAACPPEASGDQVSIYTSSWAGGGAYPPGSPLTTLRNAVEWTGLLARDGNTYSGDQDGYCESSETCLYTPHLGAYQGMGVPGRCKFSSGTVSGVTLYGY